jgi:hypothetical protein
MKLTLLYLWADITRRIAPDSKIANRAWSRATRAAGDWEA